MALMMQISSWWGQRLIEWSNRRLQRSRNDIVVRPIFSTAQLSVLQSSADFYEVHDAGIERDKEKARLLETLASDYKGDKDLVSERVPSTCEWFFEDDRFLEWRDSDGPRLLWVSAGPGCGKSVLAKALIDERKVCTNTKASTICYFFFKDGQEQRTRGANALSALLHQLFQNTSLATYALNSHRSHGKELRNRFSELWEILVRSVEDPQAGEIICVLDALDECEEKARSQLIDKLIQFFSPKGSCQNLNPLLRLKFLVTSRPYDDLEYKFQKLSGISTYIRFDGDEKSQWIGQEIEPYGSALQLASRKGYVHIVRMLLDKGADVNAQSGQYESALQAASRKDYVDIVRMLLDNGATDNEGEALKIATEKGYNHIVQLLLDYRGEEAAQSKVYSDALKLALLVASKKGYGQIVRMLLDKGAGIDNGSVPISDFALMVASEGGHSHTVRRLLDNGGTDVFGFALCTASYEGNDQVVQMLLETRWEDYTPGRISSYALDLAVKDASKMLNKRAADVDGKALGKASKRGLDHVAQIILDNGEEVYAQGGINSDALDRAVKAASKKGHDQVVRMLRAFNESPDVRNLWLLFGSAR